jgi:parallel beta-helix repeat protein
MLIAACFRSPPARLVPALAALLLACPVGAQNWVRHTVTTNVTYLTSVAASADLSKLLVSSGLSTTSSGQSGPTDLYLSTNSGVSWQVAAAPLLTNNWASPVCSADGSRMAAVGTGGIYVSADSGKTWVRSPSLINVKALAASTNGLTMVALVGANNSSPFGISYSPDWGASWSPASGPAKTNQWSTLAMSGNGLHALAAGTELHSGKQVLYISHDFGTTWTLTDAPSKVWVALAGSGNGSRWVAAALSGELYTSADSGNTWQQQAAAPKQIWAAVAYSADGSRIVAAGWYPRGLLFTSTDLGATWTNPNSPTVPFQPSTNGVGWYSAALSADGLKLAAIPGFGGTDIYTVALADLYATMTATPQIAHTGSNITVVVTAENETTNTMRNVRLASGISSSGSGGVSLITDGVTGASAILTPGQSASFTNVYQGTNAGRVTFSATVQATTPDGSFSTTCSSPLVAIVPGGDLLIKQSVSANYVGGGIFQRVPIAPQVVTNVVGGPNETSQFQIQVWNNDPSPQKYTLQAVAGGSPVWQETFSLSAQDVTANLLGGSIALPTLAPGEATTLTVSLQDTNPTPGDVSAVVVSLGVASDPTLALDAVKAVTLLVPEIIVNSTGDLPNKDPNGCCCDTGNTLADGKTPECTLRAAIDLANRLNGKQIIHFQIPSDDPGIVSGVPSIRPEAPLPDITNAVVIDGWSQSSRASRPPVELSGQALPLSYRPGTGNVGGELSVQYLFSELTSGGETITVNGLHIVADRCEIRGLAINSFSTCGLLVDGAGTVLQGNYIGTDPSGAASAPSGVAFYRLGHDLAGGYGAQVCLRSGGNLVGGTGPNEGNVISGGPNWETRQGEQVVMNYGPPGLVILGEAANANEVQGNIIGFNATATGLPTVPAGTGGRTVLETHNGPYVGVWISDGSDNRVSGNIIAGNYHGIAITGSALGNVVAGNQIGWSPNAPPTLDPYADRLLYGEEETGVWLAPGSQHTTIGGADPAAGNVFSTTAKAVLDQAGSDVVQGNWMGASADGKTALEVGWGIWAQNLAQPSKFIGNTIANVTVGIQLDASSQCSITGNSMSNSLENAIAVHTGSAGTVIVSNTIARTGNKHVIGPPFGIGIYIPQSESGAATISQNSISDSTILGIGFNENGTPYVNKDGVPPVGVLFASPPPIWTNGQLKITGTVVAPVGGGTYLIEFFASPRANPNGYGEGQNFLGSATVSVNLLGNADLDVTLPSPTDLSGQFLTATATDAAGITSEFSPAALIETCAPGVKGICPGVEQQVPNSNGPRVAGRRSKGSPSTGDGNGDGIPDWQESNVASLPSLPGLWVTLSAPPGIVLEDVTPTGPPEFAGLPAGYVFPVGFLSFGVTNLPTGGAVTLTNFLHLDADPNFSYAATTYFNFGPTPDNPAPHWYPFLFDGKTGAELLPDQIILHLQDGAHGDGDARVNGNIVTVGAPAYALAPAPQLSLTIASVGLSNIVDILPGTNTTSILVTNPIPLVSTVLSWPASATNSVLQFLDDLSPPDILNGLTLPGWQSVLGTPINLQGRNFLTNTTLGPSGFYRLFPTR